MSLFCVTALCFFARVCADWTFFNENSRPQNLPYMADWMSNVPDNTPFWRLSVPGTHDSGTSGVSATLDRLAKCQAWTIPQQLQNGIRFLDIRVRASTGTTNPGIWHTDFYCNTRFREVTQQVADFLTQHPSEFVIMKLKHEDRDVWNTAVQNLFPHPDDLPPQETTNQVKQILASFGDKVWYSLSNSDTISRLRGKIVILDHRSFGVGVEQPPAKDDYAQTNTATKLTDITSFIAARPTGRAFSAWWNVKGDFDPHRLKSWNFLWSCLSGCNYDILITSTPATWAAQLNGNLLNGRVAAKDDRFGIQVFDFPGEVLIAAVVRQNSLTAIPPTFMATPANSDGGGDAVYVERHNVNCGEQPGSAISAFQLERPTSSQVRVAYWCQPKSLGSCSSYSTPMQPNGGGSSWWWTYPGSTFYLDRHYVNCPSGKVLQRFRVIRSGDKWRYDYSCCSVDSLGASESAATPWKDAGNGNLVYLDRHRVMCSKGKALTSLHLGRSGGNIRWEYSCA